MIIKKKLQKEYNSFKEISGLDKFGIRMHYLRQNKNTKKYLSDIGFLFDTTDLQKSNYKIIKKNNMYIIPFQIMDGILFNFNQKSFSFEEAKKYTLNLLENAEKNNQKYFSILIHQRYFSDDFYTWKNWYMWFIDYCKNKNYKFCFYKDLIK